MYKGIKNCHAELTCCKMPGYASVLFRELIKIILFYPIITFAEVITSKLSYGVISTLK